MIINKENLKHFEEKIKKYKNTEGPLLPVLHLTEDMFGYIPIEAQEIIQDVLKISNATVNGVLSFYDLFHTVPTGRHRIGVCSGTSCHIGKSLPLLKKLEDILSITEGETTKDGLFTIIPVKCIGRCETSPNMIVDDDIYEFVNIEKIANIINKYK